MISGGEVQLSTSRSLKTTPPLFLVMLNLRLRRGKNDIRDQDNGAVGKGSWFNQRIGPAPPQFDTLRQQPYAPSYHQSSPVTSTPDIDTHSDRRPSVPGNGKQICPSCKREVPVGFPGCPYCDHVFGGVAQAEAPINAIKAERGRTSARRSRASVPPAPMPPAPTPQDTGDDIILMPVGRCPKCGAPIMPNTYFCRKCGWRVMYGELVH